LSNAIRERWAELWSQYLAFYGIEEPRDVFDSTWSRLFEPEGCIRGFGVRDESHQGFLFGTSHYVLHDNMWTTTQDCFLQDLYVHPAWRRQGIARNLILGVADAARVRGCETFFWLTMRTIALLALCTIK